MNTQLYTDQLDTQTADLIRRIPSGDAQAFISTPFCIGGTTTTAPGYIEWFEAKQAPGTSLWTLKKHTRLGNLELENAHEEEKDKNAQNKRLSATRSTRTTLQGLCFFAALYFCAQQNAFRSQTEDAVQVPQEDFSTLKIKHPLLGRVIN